MVIVYKARDSLTSVFKICYSPDLERADFDRQRFQYTWLNSYFFSSLRESLVLLRTTWLLRDSKKFCLQQLSLKPPVLVLLRSRTWGYRHSIVTLTDSGITPVRPLHVLPGYTQSMTYHIHAQTPEYSRV